MNNFQQLENLEFQILQLRKNIRDIKKQFQPPKRLINNYFKQNNKLIKELVKSIDCSYKVKKTVCLQPVEIAHTELNNINCQIRHIQDNLIKLKNQKIDIPLDINSKKTIEKYNNKLKEYNQQKKELIKSLKSDFFYKQAIDENYTCPITLEDFKKGDLIFKTKCNHKFKYEGIKNWIKTKKKFICPYCKQKMIEDKYSYLFKKFII